VAAREWAATLARVVLAAIWAWAGASKIGDPAAAVRAVRAYRLLPEWLAQGVGYGLPFLELTLAVLLLAGLATRVAAVASAALLAVFLAGMVSAAARGLQIECGCFGGGGDLAAGQSTSYPWEIGRDAALLLVSLALARWPRSRLALDDRVRASAASTVDAHRVGPRRTAEARRRMVELADRRRREGERRVRIAGAAAVVLLLLVGGVGVAMQAGRDSAPAGPTPQAVTAENGVTIGRADARVVVDLYEDPQCPACRQFEQEIGPSLAEWIQSGSTKVNYHVVSFLDRASSTHYSSRAANAFYCAADAGVFVRYHDLLYAAQPAEGTPGLPDDQLVQFGRQAGATSDSFAQCVTSGRYSGFVGEITERSSRAGVVATPTVLVNGAPIQTPTLEAVRAAVNEAS
jgi:protein-disulfide isomerase